MLKILDKLEPGNSLSPLHISHVPATLSVLGEVALYATVNNKRHFTTNDLETLLSEQHMFHLKKIIDRWKYTDIFTYNNEKDEYSFNYLILQEFLAASKLAEFFIDAEKNPEEFDHARTIVSTLYQEPHYEYIVRFISGHLIHHELAQERLFYLISSHCENHAYQQSLLASCLVEAGAPPSLSKYLKQISQSQKTDGAILSWLLEESKEILANEPKLRLTILSLHAQTLLKSANTPRCPSYFYSFNSTSRELEWPFAEFTKILESLISGYPDLMLPLLTKTLSSHPNLQIRLGLVKALGQLPFYSHQITDLLINVVYLPSSKDTKFAYYGPHSEIKAAAITALGSICQKYPDSGLFLLRSLASSPERSEGEREAAVTALRELHPSVYDNQVFPILKRIILEDPSISLRTYAIRALHATDATKTEMQSLLEKSIVFHKTQDSSSKEADEIKGMKKEALLKLYPFIKQEDDKGIALLGNLILAADSNHVIMNFVFDELLYFSDLQPAKVIAELNKILREGRNSSICYKAADFAGKLARHHPNEILALYRELQSDSTLFSFNREYLILILLQMGTHSPELVFPLMIDCALESIDEKEGKTIVRSTQAIRGIGMFGKVDSKLAFETLSKLIQSTNDPFILRDIAEALGFLGKSHPTEALQLLMPLLSIDDLETSLIVLNSLAHINHDYPDIVKEKLVSQFTIILGKDPIHEILQKGIRKCFELLSKELRDCLFSAPDTYEDLVPQHLARDMARIINLKPAIFSEMILKAVKDLSHQEKNPIVSRDNEMQTLHFLLKTLSASDPLLAKALVAPVKEIDPKT